MHERFSDRYAIRTRNLQDWNLTRCRCANRSKGYKERTPPRYSVDDDAPEALAALVSGMTIATRSAAAAEKAPALERFLLDGTETSVGLVGRRNA